MYMLKPCVWSNFDIPIFDIQIIWCNCFRQPAGVKKETLDFQVVKDHVVRKENRDWLDCRVKKVTRVFQVCIYNFREFINKKSEIYFA